MALKRKRERKEDDVDLVNKLSPSKKHKVETSEIAQLPSNNHESDKPKTNHNQPVDNKDTDEITKTPEIKISQISNCSLSESIFDLNHNQNEQKIEENDDCQLVHSKTTPIKLPNIKQSTCNLTGHPSPIEPTPKKNEKIIKKNQQKNDFCLEQLSKLDLIVPSPADDLCDRHLVLVYIASPTSCSENDKKENEEDGDGDDIAMDSDFNILGLDNDEFNDGNLCGNEYQMIKIANYALSIKSDYFRNLLSNKSAFAECKQSFVVIKIERCYAFSMCLLLRLLHINEQEMEKYLVHIENYQTLLQILLLIDRFRIKHLSNAIMNRLKFLALRKRPKQTFLSRTNRVTTTEENESEIIHICEQFNPCFDNGGMSLLQVSNLLLLENDFLFLPKVQKIAQYALCQRYKFLTFDEFGIVDIEFRKLPCIAINVILKNNDFCSFNENDVFLAATQWAAFALHCNDKEDKYAMNVFDNKQEIVSKRFGQICKNIRFQYVDDWYIDSIVTHYDPVKFNQECLLKLLKNATKNNLLSTTRHHHTHTQQRYKEIFEYFEKQCEKRPIPFCNLLNNASTNKKDKMSLLPLQEITNGNSEWQTLRNENNLTTNARLIEHREYDSFKVVFWKRDLKNLSVGHRKTSSYMVWHGVVFALDLVRKKMSRQQRNEHGREGDDDSVGVFLYCQGLECADHIWIKYALKVVNHENALQCSDYKMMQLNFQKGNGSRDFFACSWDTFLNTYFDTNDQITFNLQFIDAK